MMINTVLPLLRLVHYISIEHHVVPKYNINGLSINFYSFAISLVTYAPTPADSVAVMINPVRDFVSV